MLGDVITEALPRHQAEAESLLVDRCTFERKTGRQQRDPVTGISADVWESYASGVPCQVGKAGLVPRTTAAGADVLSSTGRVLKVSVDSVDPQVDDRAIVTSSRDATLVGKVLYIRAVPRGTLMVLRRLMVDEVADA